MAENAGPLDEIEFWRNRCVDLSGITSQLEKPGVKHITQILELAKSSYVAPFLRLSSQIIVSCMCLKTDFYTYSNYCVTLL